MVQIRRPNVSRRVRGPGGMNGGLLGRLQSLASDIPYLSQLSPVDQMLALFGAALLAVVSFSYIFLLSGAFSFSSPSSRDPRLSSELRKTGLSDEALLVRGGGKRIMVGPNQLDSNENAVAHDIIRVLKCDALQEEVEREWHYVLDDKKLRAEEEAEWGAFDRDQDRLSGDSGGGWGWEWGKDGKAGEGGIGNHVEGEGDQEWGDGRDRSASGDGYAGSGDGNVQLDDATRRRRLEVVDDVPMDDLDWQGGDTYGNPEPSNQGLKITGRHLFCLAAEAITLPRSTKDGEPDPSTHCNMNSFDLRDELLYLWSSARSQIPEDVIQKTLRHLKEHKETLRGNEVHVWYPDGDGGAEGMLRVLNSAYEGRSTYNFDSEPAETGHDDLYRFHDLPSKLVGPNKLFVDVGSALGFTSMLVSYLYPGTTIVSIEPASPSWLIQNINYRCNLSHNQLQFIHPILAGVGTKHHDDNDSMMKMIWRPSFTTATRSWNPEKEFDFAKDMELTVHLRTLKAILAEATPDDLPLGTPISVLNLDCEGCEYNLIPSMHETSFKSIGVILGRTNWGYIPTIKKPSSQRARETHERVCSHYNFAKRCKECCDFPSLAVKPRLDSAAGSDREPPSLTEKTVAELAGDMCNGFEEWAKSTKLRDIPDDFGWNEMSAFAAFN